MLDQAGTSLTQYDAMRNQVALCATVDEAKDIRDKAAALVAYARQRDDRELQTWVSEIHLRACQRIGQLSRDLEKAEPDRGHGNGVPAGGKSKGDALADAGISTSTAHRYEELAGGRDERAMDIAVAVTETYFSKAQQEQAPPTAKGLIKAIRGAITETFGEPAPRQKTPRAPPAEPQDHRYIEWVGNIRGIAEAADFDPEHLARRTLDFPQLVAGDRKACEAAKQRIDDFIAALDVEISHAKEA